MQSNFGYSLLASYCEQFVFEFVLHGTSDRSFLSNLHQRLVFSKQVSTVYFKLSIRLFIIIFFLKKKQEFNFGLQN